MADTRETNKLQSNNQNAKNHYIREKIVEKKRKPIYFLIRLCVGVLAVVVMGFTAGASYALVNNWLNSSKQNENRPSHTLGYGDESTEESDFYDTDSSGEGSLGEDETGETSEVELPSQGLVISEKWLEEFLKRQQYTINDIRGIEETLKSVYTNIQKSIVTIQVSDVGETNLIPNLSQIQTISGIIVSITESEVILLVDGNLFDSNAVLTAYPNTSKSSILEIRAKDDITGMTALAMSVENFSESEYRELKAITLGYSGSCYIGQTILLLGSPSGFTGSVQYGYITYVERNIDVVDGEQAILWTDCLRVNNSNGAMFNIKGELIGWIDTISPNTNGLQSAIGITDLNHIIEDIILGKNSAYLGIKGCSVTNSMFANYGLPNGIYVTEVELNSAAYTSGIQLGDVITKINGSVVLNMPTLQNILASLEEGDKVTIVLQRKGKDGYKERTITLNVQGR